MQVAARGRLGCNGDVQSSGGTTMLYLIARVAIVCCGFSLCACASREVIASPKQFTPSGATAPWRIGGIFNKRDKSVVISINDDKVVRASFPPFTPNINANAEYDGHDVRTHCAFSSGIMGRGHHARIAASIVASASHTAGNTCRVTVDGEAPVTLYF
jgi:hypothetical protein